MQFTPQQLAGGGRYSNKTKIGNWSEDEALEQLRLADYLHRKRTGKLLAAQDRKVELFFNSRVPHSYSADGTIRFGDTIMLSNDSTGAVLASNLDASLSTTSESYQVSASPGESKSGPSPVARNTFVVMKWPKFNYQDNLLRTGQPFLLAANPSLRVDEQTGLLRPPVCLSSRIVSTMNYAQMSNHQQVTLVGGEIRYECVWVVDNISDRNYHSKGEIVQAGNPYIITHGATRSPLAADPAFPMATNFGGEYEVACHPYLSTKKTLTMIREKDGITTGDVGQRRQGSQNFWRFVMSSDPAAAEDKRQFLPMTADGILAKIKAAIRARGNTSFRSLGRTFRGMDDRGDGVLDQADFKWGLADYGISLTDDEFSVLLRRFDTNNDGVVSFDEFIEVLADPPSGARLAIINEAFDALDKTHDGRITLADLAGVYDASQHPKVLSGEKSESAVLSEFLSLWDTQDADGVVTRSEFVQYFKQMSAGIDDDDYFVQMVSRAWKVGAEGKK